VGLSPELACVDGADGVEKLKCCTYEATSGDSARRCDHQPTRTDGLIPICTCNGVAEGVDLLDRRGCAPESP
jgi:hypothetical protein